MENQTLVPEITKKHLSKKWLIIIPILISLVACLILGVIIGFTTSGSMTSIVSNARNLIVKPNVTPIPTELPTLTAAEEERLYMIKLQPLFERVSYNLDEFFELSEIYSANPSWITDKELVSDYLEILDKIHEDMVAVSELTPPAKYATGHSYLISAKEEFFLVKSFMKSGVTNIDPNDFYTGMVHLQLFNEYIGLATDAFKQ